MALLHQLNKFLVHFAITNAVSDVIDSGSQHALGVVQHYDVRRGAIAILVSFINRRRRKPQDSSFAALRGNRRPELLRSQVCCESIRRHSSALLPES